MRKIPWFDVALLILIEDVSISLRVMPICISNKILNSNLTNQVAEVSGYGQPPRAPPQPTTYGWNVGNDISDADYDEAIRRSYETLREDTGPTTFPESAPPDADEVRRRRLNRFNLT